MKEELQPNPFEKEYDSHKEPPFLKLRFSVVANEWFSSIADESVRKGFDKFKTNVTASCHGVRVLETSRSTKRLSLGSDYSEVEIVAEYQVVDLYGPLNDNSRNEAIKHFRIAAYDIASKLQEVYYVHLSFDRKNEYYTLRQ